ncbi:MAG TPA: hypothetical protein VHC43_16635 [Mycobacteriales bacterium]|nr:hypothetical protein [Mycobacteriales bacterium]
MIWWVLGAAVLVIVGLVYVTSHESDLCGVRQEERAYTPPRRRPSR